MAASDAPITIKKYRNRRLYDASSGTDVMVLRLGRFHVGLGDVV
jgi:polyhydroxyalkanoate synthesis regulator protein